MYSPQKTRIVKFGKSRGVRIPAEWDNKFAIGDEVELAVKSNRIVIQPSRRAREGWEEQFRLMAENGDDRLLDETPPTLWDKEEWEW